MEASSDKVRSLQDAENQIVSELSKAKEEKRILEMKTGYCKTSRISLYHQWKEGNIKKEQYLAQKEEIAEQEAECGRKLDILNRKLSDMALVQSNTVLGVERESFPGNLILTKGLSNALIERIDVYEADRIEITWKFRDILSC